LGAISKTALCAPPISDSTLSTSKVGYELVASRTDVPVPQILFADSSRETFDRNYVLMTKVNGELAGSLRSLEDDDWRAIYRAMGKTLRALHEITFDRFGYFTESGFAKAFRTNAEFMQNRFEQVLQAFGELGGPPNIQGAVRDLVFERREVFTRCTTAALCHNDLHEGNVLVSKVEGKWGLTGVLDTGGSVAGDPLFDLRGPTIGQREAIPSNVGACWTATARCAPVGTTPSAFTAPITR